MTQEIKLPPARQPFINEKTGQISREWHLYLLSLTRQSGSSAEVIGGLDPVIAVINEHLAGLDAEIVVLQEGLVEVNVETSTLLAGKEPNLPATPASPATKVLDGNRTWAEKYAAADGSVGISTTITTEDLVGKTITVKDGLITGFA